MKPLMTVCLMSLTACGDDPSTLISKDQIVDDGIPVALTDSSGDAARGEVVFADRDQGHCVLCHVVEGLQTPFQGNVGPDLSAIGNRLTDAQLRLRIVDYQIVLPGALMPSYYRKHALYQVQRDYDEATILTAQQVEDLVAYLGQLEMDKPNDG
ncbi:MAG: sulfur oxidation c-type cytochrome SoxX [Pseudomonadota bacterium]